MKIVIVIPIYSPFPQKEELSSLRQCLKVLGNYEISFIAPEGLETKEYDLVISEFDILRVKYEFFDTKWFKGIAGYNKLCLSQILYNRFKKYDYMLIYQLDTWVFEDSLSAWCEQGWDYIGAPWIERVDGKEKILVGNGGLSLRKIQFFRNVLACDNNIMTWTQWFKKCRYLKDYIMLLFHWCGYHADGSYYIGRLANEINEDVIISKLLINTKYTPSIPEAKIAVGFAIEREPSRMYEMNGSRLPFGCHAFKRWEYESFWKKFIKI